MVQFTITILLILWGFYYLTVVAHLLGVKIFNKVDINIGLAFIPFYYWFKREVVK